MVQNFYGTPSYSSFNQINYIRFLQAVGIAQPGDESSSRWAVGLNARTLLMSLASVKYTLTKNPQSERLQQGYEQINAFGDVRVLRNKYSLPLGFTYDKYISSPEFSKLQPEAKDRALLAAFVAEEQAAGNLNLFARFNPQSITGQYTIIQYAADTDALRKETLVLTRRTQNLIEGNIAVQKPKMLFLSIPYDKGWSAKVDGKDVQIRNINVGFMGIFLQAGAHTVSVTFHPPYLAASAAASGLSLLLYAGLGIIFRNKQPKA